MQLYLDEWGASLHVKDAMFVVRRKDAEDRAFAIARVRRIVLMPGTRITTDAILRAIKRQIEIHIMQRNGEPVGMFWSHRYGSISTIRIQQARFVDSAAGRAWVREQIIDRLKGQQGHLASLRRRRRAMEGLLTETIELLHRTIGRIGQIELSPAATFRNSLRGMEGTASRQYFRALAAVIPEAYAFERRHRPNAQDPFNATLNYLLGILYGKVEGALIKAGVDPYMGIYHRNMWGKPVLTYDFIEPFRVWAEAMVVHLCFARALEENMFTSSEDGKALLLNRAGKRLVIPAFQEYLEQVVDWRGRRRSRGVHITLAAQDFAQYLLKWDGENNA